MPLAIMLMGVVFNVLNGLMQGEWLFYLAPEGLYTDAWLSTPSFWFGIILFFIGMGINLHSDSVIRHLRKPGRYTSLFAAEGNVPICHFGQLFWRVGGMDRVCRTHLFACCMGVCTVDVC